MRRLWPLAALVGWLPALLAAESSPEALLAEGNRAYQAGEYAAARDAYQAVVAQGLGGFELYHNLGNVHFRLGSRGRARLWYERALSLRADEDTRFNRDLLRAAAQEPPESGLGAWLGRHAPLLGWGALAANALLFLFLSLGLHRDREWLWWGRWSAAAIWAVLLVLGALGWVQRRASRGVVVGPRAEARAGPSAEERVVFTVPEGRRLAMLDRLEDWILVGLPEEGLKGWVPRPAIEPVSPGSGP